MITRKKYEQKMRITHRNFDQWNNQKNTQMTLKAWHVHIRTQQQQYLTPLNSKNMEPKKKINWQAVWIIIKNILIALLTANALEQRL